MRRSIAALDAVALGVVEAAGLTGDDRVLSGVPTTHSYGMENGMLGPLLAGATLVSVGSIDPRAMELALTEHGASVLPGVPFFFESLSNRPPPRPHHLRLVYSAGGALPDSVATAFARTWGVPIGQLYGATEIGSVTFEDPASPGFNPGRVGRPMRDVALLIADPDQPECAVPVPPNAEGQVLVRSASMLDGYLAEPAGLIDAFFATGDLGRCDEEGRLSITGRLKLMIDIGGAKVNPLEVERVLCTHPSVGECVVVAMAVSPTVSRLRAIVTARPGLAPPTDTQVRAWARERLAGYKVPRVVEVRQSLPKSATGKVLRRLLEEGA